ncbi:MAG: hypothetical protein WCA63_05665 [Gallionella sp.]|jgi:hypothetical protein
MRKAILMLFMFAIGYSTNSNAVMLKGAIPCGEWVSTRSTLNAMIYDYWLIGYLSGVADSKNKNFLQGTDTASFELWMDNYCQKNPLDTIGDGGHELANELIKRTH